MISSMKHLILIAITLLTFAGAQGQEGRRERIKSLKIAYLTERLELSAEEAQQFWPIYNEHEAAIYNLRVAEMGKIKQRLNRDGMNSLTDAEAEKMLNQYQEIERRIFELERKFVKDLRAFMTPKRVLYLGVLEEKFRRELLRKYQNKRDDNRR